MNDDIERENMILPDRTSARILARAAAIDSATSGGPSIAQLKAAAAEAGISSTSFDAALVEFSAHELAELERPTPWWVKLCMAGITDRRAAMILYWTFQVMVFVLPATALLLLPGSVPAGTRLALSLLGIGFATFAMWSTSRAVRWLDHHGWQRLT
jgi:hypothetical protein